MTRVDWFHNRRLLSGILGTVQTVGLARAEQVSTSKLSKTEERFRPGAHVVVRSLFVALIGMLAGGGLNAALGEQGADTPALALLGGGLALGVVIVARARRRARRAQDD